MNKGGVGVGSASIVLVFAVLCLTVFSLITFVVAHNDKVLAEAESKFVLGYYEADTLAERVLAEILAKGYQPGTDISDNILGVDVQGTWEFDMDSFMDSLSLSYSCPISDRKFLYVGLTIIDDSYEIHSWSMRDTGEWEMDTIIQNLWQGFDEDDDLANLWSGD